MVDEDGYDHSAWMWNNDVVTYCENIGCSSLIRNNIADQDDFRVAIKNSSYCAIATHGPDPDEEIGQIFCDMIQWSMKDVYYGHENEFGWFTTDDLNRLSDDYFENTRCVALVACYAGYGGEDNPDNFVNVLQSKGVETVVGFKLPTQTAVNKETKVVYTDRGSQKWLKEFTKFLGEGKNVITAVQMATQATTINGFSYGTEHYYIAGNEYQIVKH